MDTKCGPPHLMASSKSKESFLSAQTEEIKEADYRKERESEAKLINGTITGPELSALFNLYLKEGFTESFSQILKSIPSSTANYYMGALYYQAQMFPEAKKYLAKAKSLVDDDPRINRLLFYCYALTDSLVLLEKLAEELSEKHFDENGELRLICDLKISRAVFTDEKTIKKLCTCTNEYLVMLYLEKLLERLNKFYRDKRIAAITYILEKNAPLISSKGQNISQKASYNALLGDILYLKSLCESKDRDFQSSTQKYKVAFTIRRDTKYLTKIFRNTLKLSPEEGSIISILQNNSDIAHYPGIWRLLGSLYYPDNIAKSIHCFSVAYTLSQGQEKTLSGLCYALATLASGNAHSGLPYYYKAISQDVQHPMAHMLSFYYGKNRTTSMDLFLKCGGSVTQWPDMFDIFMSQERYHSAYSVALINEAWSTTDTCSELAYELRSMKPKALFSLGSFRLAHDSISEDEDEEFKGLCSLLLGKQDHCGNAGLNNFVENSWETALSYYKESDDIGSIAGSIACMFQLKEEDLKSKIEEMLKNKEFLHTHAGQVLLYKVNQALKAQGISHLDIEYELDHFGKLAIPYILNNKGTRIPYGYLPPILESLAIAMQYSANRNEKGNLFSFLLVSNPFYALNLHPLFDSLKPLPEDTSNNLNDFFELGMSRILNTEFEAIPEDDVEDELITQRIDISSMLYSRASLSDISSTDSSVASDTDVTERTEEIKKDTEVAERTEERKKDTEVTERTKQIQESKESNIEALQSKESAYKASKECTQLSGSESTANQSPQKQHTVKKDASHGAVSSTSERLTTNINKTNGVGTTRHSATHSVISSAAEKRTTTSERRSRQRGPKLGFLTNADFEKEFHYEPDPSYFVAVPFGESDSDSYDFTDGDENLKQNIRNQSVKSAIPSTDRRFKRYDANTMNLK